MAKVILTALLRVMLHWRSDGGRWNQEDRADHGVRAREGRTEAHEADVVIGHPAEHSLNDLSSQGQCQLVCFFWTDPFDAIPLGHQGSQALLPDLGGLLASAPIASVLATALHLAGQSEHLRPSLLRGQLHEVPVAILADEQLAAFNTYATSDFHHGAQELNVEHGTSETDVTVVTRSLHVVEAIRWADEPGLSDTHARVIGSVHNRLVVYDRIPGCDLGH